MPDAHPTAPAPTVKAAEPGPADTRPDTQGKPAKPTPDFPLFPHATKRWAKKIRGKLYYFGPWNDAEGALKKYLEQRDALHGGRKAREAAEALTVVGLGNLFLLAKRALVDSGELAERTWEDYKDVKDLLVKHLGKLRLVEDLGPDDFTALRNKMAKKWGPVRLGNVIQRVRSIFKFAADSDLIPRPVRFGPGFKRPSAKVIRQRRAARGPMLFTAEEIRRLLAEAGPQLRAMILLGINAGFGNSDCGNLPLSAVDLDAGMIDFPRPKTGIPRRCPLWPETVEAIREALARRPAPKSQGHAGLVFITKYGLPWANGTPSSPVSQETAKLLRALGIGGRQRLGFYTLRHTFRTVADESKDQPAVDFIMGHEVPHMSAVYRETISDTRLRAVAEHVRAWLFAGKGGGRQDGAQGGPDAAQATRAG